MDYQGRRWKNKRAKILRHAKYKDQELARYGKTAEATVVHHIFPAEDYPQYAWEDWNLVSVSQTTHNALHDRNTGALTKRGVELLERTARKKGIDL